MSELEGKTVTKVREMTVAELQSNYWTDWHQGVVVIEFDDGTQLFASRDVEGNGPGCLFTDGPEGPGRIMIVEGT